MKIGPPFHRSPDEDKSEDEDHHAEKMTSDIRYLLARRLARENPTETKPGPIIPETQVDVFDEFMGALAIGWDESLAANERAKALAAAAYIALRD